ncbi:MAG: STAS domain-containing protein [Actinocatenispora sp.]
MELSLQTDTVADRTVLQVSGEIDVYTAPKLRQRLVELVDEDTRRLVIDLRGVEFLDSTGLGVLVGGLKRMRALGGSLVLVCAHERILKIFRITGLDRIFTIVESVDRALEVNDADQTGLDGAAQDGSTGDRAAPPAADR